jgi:Tol biopolymer transport system component
VVYPKNNEEISLTDVETGKELATTHLPGWGRLPLWSVDGANLAIIANIVNDSSATKNEFFIVSKDGGEFRQLTHLTDEFDHVSIDNYAWSPDGKQIAFWLNDGTRDTTMQGKASELMLLDVTTGEITDLCMQGISIRFNDDTDGIHMIYPQPVWSPDGSQIMITQLDTKNSKKYNVLVVDIASKSAYKVAENLEPVGWMTKEP